MSGPDVQQFRHLKFLLTGVSLFMASVAFAFSNPDKTKIYELKTPHQSVLPWVGRDYSCAKIFMNSSTYGGGGKPPGFYTPARHGNRELIKYVFDGSSAYQFPNNSPMKQDHKISEVRDILPITPRFPLGQQVFMNMMRRRRLEIKRDGYSVVIPVGGDSWDHLYDLHGQAYVNVLGYSRESVVGDISDTYGDFIRTLRNPLMGDGYKNAIKLSRLPVRNPQRSGQQPRVPGEAPSESDYYENVPWIISGVDPAETGYSDNTFDLLFSHWSELSYPQDRPELPAEKLQSQILKEMMRILKVGGEMRVAYRSADTGKELEELIRSTVLLVPPEGETQHEWYFDVENHTEFGWLRLVKRQRPPTHLQPF